MQNPWDQFAPAPQQNPWDQFARVAQQPMAPEPVPSPAEGMNPLQRGLVGAGASAARAVEGGLGAFGATPKVLPKATAWAREKAEQMRGDRETFEQYRDDLGGAGKVGEVAGAIGSAAPLALLGTTLVPQVVAGGVYGALTTPGDLGERGVGAATDAAGAGVGGVLTRTLGRLVNPVGVRPQSVKDLEAAGINPTYGQIRGAMSDPGGPRMNRLEQSMQSMPFGGASLRGAREAPLTQFQAATRKGAAPPGASPEDMASVDALRSAFNREYDTVLSNPGWRVRDIYDVEDGVLRASDMVAISPERMQTAQRFVNNTARRHEYAQGMNPTLKQAHAVESDIATEAARLMRSTDADQQAMGQVLRGISDDIGASWRGQAPPDARQAVDALDKAYSAYVPVRQAARTAAVSGSPDEYTPNVLLRALRQTDRTPNKNQYIAGTRPQQGLSTAAEHVLKRGVADSGTPERLIGMESVLSPKQGARAWLGGRATEMYASPTVQDFLTRRGWRGNDTTGRISEALRGPGSRLSSVIGAGYGGEAFGTYLGENY